jgi:succinate-semialdehyde dehydrogenase/glutarate-semialdehyde dehydrogenase
MATQTLIDPATRSYRTVNPATGELVREFATATEAEAEALLAQAHAAYLGWREIPVPERVALFSRLVDLFQERIDEFARMVTLEMGKPLAQSQLEATTVVSIFKYVAANGERLLAEEVVDVPGQRRTVTRLEPVGVALGIEPWNAPLYQAMRATAPNVMLGNTVLLKPAEISPGSTLLFDSLFLDAGFPEHVYQTALVSIAQVSTYIADPRIRAITLTGSDRAGSSVGEQAGRQVKPVVLELGGSDAFVVLESADVPKAAAIAAMTRLFISGQICTSPKRIIVTEGVAGEFIAAFVQVYANQVVGDPFDAATTVGPLSSAAGVDLLQGQYEDAIDKGATVLVPGGRVDGPGSFFTPAVITDVTATMRLFHEEAFGPLAVIYRVPDADSAIRLANGSQYGLSGTVFGEDLKEACRVADALDTGMVGINTFFGAPAEVPFGGTKRSGFGRELGRTGFAQFANVKSYSIG